MANYRKSFNLRNGVQVDNDNFVVNANGLVGIGTSVPLEYLLNVYGDARVTGLITTNNLYSSQATVNSLTSNQGIVAAGVITAANFSGSASGLTDIYAIAVDGWIVNSSSSSISTSFKVGVGTTSPQYALQVGNPISGEGVYIDSSNGNIFSTGGIIASSLTGSLDALYLTGTIDSARIPSSINVTNIISGIVTASSGFYGNLTGVASTASSITPSSNIIVNSINSGFSTSGISTVYTKLHVQGNVGVGTDNPNSQLHLRKSGTSSIQLTSDGSNSSEITFGRNVTITTNNGQIRFGNTDGVYSESTEQSLDIINYDVGNFNFYLNPGGSGTGSYNWFKSGISKIMTLTSSGNLGINSSNPSSKLSVVGDCSISGITTVGDNLIVNGTSTTTDLVVVNDASVGSDLIVDGKVAIKNSLPAYDLQVGSDPTILNGVGISSGGGVIASGIITSTGGFTSGIGITNPVKISVSGNVLTFTVTGVGATSLTLYP